MINPKNDFPGLSERYLLVDWVRSLSIAAVLAVHLGDARFAQHLSYKHHDFLTWCWNAFGRNGAYGVTIFFVVSGFLITRILVEDRNRFNTLSLRTFYIRRIARIFPLLLLTTVIGAFFLLRGAVGSPQFRFCYHSADVGPGLWASLATFCFNWYRIYHESKIFGFGLHWDVLWSLSVEEQFYLLYPLILIGLGTKRKAYLFLGGLILLAPLFRLLTFCIAPHHYLMNAINSFGILDQLATGCLLYFAVRETPALFAKHQEMAILLMGLGFMVVGATYYWTNANLPRNLIYAPSFLSCGLFIGLWGGLHITFPENWLARLFALPGKMSYGMYLLHTSLLYVLWDYARWVDPWPSFFLFFSFTTAIASLSYKAFEKPANSWIRRHLMHPLKQ
jgi:peptidoglycan/LPS O-acetylase OafA/YrhL